MKVLVILSLVGLTAVAAKASQQYYCGRRLANTLAVLCYQDGFEKRSGNGWTEGRAKAYGSKNGVAAFGGEGEAETYEGLQEAEPYDSLLDAFENRGVPYGSQNGAEAYSSELGAENWWLERPQALSSRGKRGVVQECCEKPCSLDELLSYC